MPIPKPTSNLWTDQSTPGFIKCAHCDLVYPAYDGVGMWFESKDGSARVSYPGILLHCRNQHPAFYAMKYRQDGIASQFHGLEFRPMEGY